MMLKIWECLVQETQNADGSLDVSAIQTALLTLASIGVLFQTDSKLVKQELIIDGSSVNHFIQSIMKKIKKHIACLLLKPTKMLLLVLHHLSFAPTRDFWIQMTSQKLQQDHNLIWLAVDSIKILSFTVLLIKEMFPSRLFRTNSFPSSLQLMNRDFVISTQTDLIKPTENIGDAQL